MDVSHILDNLNEDQRKAVTSEKQHLLVLAGAGSGKRGFLFIRLHGK
jgi:DNA helicase-2/ATP-dependent DNA helicase PcrA